MSFCCTNTNENCRDNSVQNIQCDESSGDRPEAFAAFNEFVAGNPRDTDAFFFCGFECVGQGDREWLRFFDWRCKYLRGNLGADIKSNWNNCGADI